jgi:flagellar biosynthesis/type III secretory pathway M-ring protein FliF/YscJ
MSDWKNISNDEDKGQYKDKSEWKPNFFLKYILPVIGLFVVFIAVAAMKSCVGIEDR